MSVDESQISLAKSILLGSLSRPERSLPDLNAENVATLHRSLENLVSGNNIELELSTCLAWTIAHIVPSSTRSTAFTRYLVKLARSLIPNARTKQHSQQASGHVGSESRHIWYTRSNSDESGNLDSDSDLSTPRFRLFYLVESCIQAIHRSRNVSSPTFDVTSASSAIWSGCLEDLLQLALPRRGTFGLEYYRVCRSLLCAWERHHVFDPCMLSTLRRTSLDSFHDWQQWLENNKPDACRCLQFRAKVDQDVQSMPESHGEADAEWYDQPAGVMLSSMRDDGPIAIVSMRPIRISKGSIDPQIFDIVASHIEECNSICAIPKKRLHPAGDEGALNGLGLRIKRDSRTGRHKLIESYYGFSPGYLQNLKRRKLNSKPTSVKTHALPRPEPDRNNQSSAPPIPPPHPPHPEPLHSLPVPLPIPIPPPPMATSGAFPPIPVGIPPRPPGWQGPWPPPPPPHLQFGMGHPLPMPIPFPVPPPQPQQFHPSYDRGGSTHQHGRRGEEHPYGRGEYRR